MATCTPGGTLPLEPNPLELGDAVLVITTDQPNIIKKATVADVTSVETIARAAADAAIIAGAGLNANGSMPVDETSAYGNSTILAANAQLPEILAWLKNVDTAVAAQALSILNGGLLAPAIDIVSAITAPATENDGDVYVINADSGALSNASILWQSGTTVRYTFSGTPDLSAYAAGWYLNTFGAANAVNNGVFRITAVNNALDYIEVDNGLVTDNSNDEGAVGTAYLTQPAWDGAGIWSHCSYNAATDQWTSIAPSDGVGFFDQDSRNLYFYAVASLAYLPYAASLGTDGYSAVLVAGANTVTIPNQGTTNVAIIIVRFIETVSGEPADLTAYDETATSFKVAPKEAGTLIYKIVRY